MMNLIVAKADNDAIGLNNRMPWHIGEDLKYFKRITLGKTVLMGRKTWESLPFKPLKNRRNIVISSQKDYVAEGAEVFGSVEAAIEALKGEEVFCMGGATMYRELLPMADRLFITRIFHSYEADTFFPKVDSALWRVARLSPMLYDEKEDVRYRFEVLERA